MAKIKNILIGAGSGLALLLTLAVGAHPTSSIPGKIDQAVVNEQKATSKSAALTPSPAATSTPITTSPTPTSSPKLAAEPTPVAKTASDHTYTNVDGNQIESPSSNTTGATGVCRDGTYTHAVHHQGACSSHGGVDHWL